MHYAKKYARLIPFNALIYRQIEICYQNNIFSYTVNPKYFNKIVTPEQVNVNKILYKYTGVFTCLNFNQKNNFCSKPFVNIKSA